MLGISSMNFLEYVSSKITEETSDKRETERLLQRILLAVMSDKAYSYMAGSRWWK